MRFFRKSTDQPTAAHASAARVLTSQVLSTRPPAERLPGPTHFIKSLHLFVLSTFAISQPIFDRLGERPMFLTDSNVGTPLAVLLLTATMSLLIPAVIPVAWWYTGRLVPRAREPLYAICVYLLLLLIALPIAKRVEVILPDWLTIGLGLAGAGLATCAYFAFGRLRSVVTAASAGIVIFPVLFLSHSPIRAMFSTPRKIETTSWKPIPVVMIVFDELCGMTLENGQRQIDAKRFPHFAELAQGSTWYRNATTVFPDTAQALPALLSGKLPSTLWIPGLADRPQNLFSVLKSTGDYELAVFEPISKLAPRDNEAGEATTQKSLPGHLISIVPTLARVFLVHLAPSDLQQQLPKVPPLWFGLHEDEVENRALHRGVFRYRWRDDRRSQTEHFVDCLDDSPQPALYFFHVLLPHVPWCYLPSGRRYLQESNQYELLDFKEHSDSVTFWGTDDLYVAQSQQRHLLQLEFTDRALGRFVSRLRSTGLYDKCLLVVTADHGISFRVADSRREISPANAADIMSVPLFIKKPGQHSGAISDKNVESIDILPTIADVLRIKLPLAVDGHSIFDETLPDRTEKTIIPAMGEPLMTLPASVLRDRTAVNELRARFGSSADPGGVFRIGPHPEFVGKAVADLVIMAEAPATEIEMHRFETRYSDDRDELVPCYFDGRIASAGPSPEPVEIAVAVNGIIQAVTRTYKLDGYRNHFTAMVPEQALRLGENDVQFFAFSSQAPNLKFSRCTVKVVPKK